MEGHGARYRIWNIFFFIILLPFIVLQVKNYAVSQELNGSKIAIDNLNQNISVYQQAHYVVNGVESKTRSGANNLLTYITGLRGELDRRGTTANESIASRLVQQTSLPQPSNLTHPVRRCYLLGDTIRLRKSLYESYRGKNGTDINIIQDLKMKVSLSAPLWIDPNKSKKSNFKTWEYFQDHDSWHTLITYAFRE